MSGPRRLDKVTFVTHTVTMTIRSRFARAIRGIRGEPVGFADVTSQLDELAAAHNKLSTRVEAIRRKVYRDAAAEAQETPAVPENGHGAPATFVTGEPWRGE